MILGNTDHLFSFPVQKSINLLEITVDDRLCFDEHVSNICKKITNQFNVISRFRNLIPATVLLNNNTTLPVLFYRMAFLRLEIRIS